MMRYGKDGRSSGESATKNAVPALVLLLLFSGVAAAQTPPASVIYSKPAAADVYLAAHPGASLSKTGNQSLTFKQADGSLTLLSGQGLTYQVNGEWLPSKLQIGALYDGTGWTLMGVPINVSLSGQGDDKDIIIQSGDVTLNVHAPQLTYNWDGTFTFKENGMNWLLQVSEASVSIQASIARRTGKVTHTLGYKVSGGSLSIGPKGTVEAGSDVHISHPQVLGADKQIYTVCSDWSADPNGISFTCDETKLPDAAFPYLIDPIFTAGAGVYGPVGADITDWCCDDDEMWYDIDVTAQYYYLTVPSYATVTSVVGGLAYDFDGGNTDCRYAGMTSFTTDRGSGLSSVPGAFWLHATHEFQVGYYTGGEYYCSWYMWGAGVWITYTVPPRLSPVCLRTEALSAHR